MLVNQFSGNDLGLLAKRKNLYHIAIWSLVSLLYFFKALSKSLFEFLLCNFFLIFLSPGPAIIWCNQKWFGSHTLLGLLLLPLIRFLRFCLNYWRLIKNLTVRMLFLTFTQFEKPFITFIIPFLQFCQLFLTHLILSNFNFLILFIEPASP